MYFCTTKRFKTNVFQAFMHVMSELKKRTLNGVLHSRRPLCAPPPRSRRMVHSEDTEHVNQNENTECHQIHISKKGKPEGCEKARVIMISNQYESIWSRFNHLSEPFSRCSLNIVTH